jgi:CRP/FNR family transcriptional regulator, anaerobic regulatory protein
MRLSSMPWRDYFGPDGAIDLERHATGTRKVPVRRTVYREGDVASEFALLFEGWAFRFKLLPDGRRHILSFVLPGEPIALHTLWTDRMSFSVQSLTDLDLHLFDIKALGAHMRADGDFGFRLGAAAARELMVFEDRLTDLGRRTAIERVAGLLLSLRARLTQRGLVDGETFPFPLRQQHIADALGLTPVHVSRVFSELRAARLITRIGSSIAILDQSKLLEIAGL